MNTPAPADLQRWSAEVARDAGSLAFLPLARAYRRQGRRDAAQRLCLRGLERHPSLVEAHALLALLYFEAGDRVQAADEWSLVLRLDPSNFEALRGLGYYYLEQDDLSRARRHLERAALLRPGDRAVQEALRLVRERQDTSPWAAEPAAAEPRLTRAEPAAAVVPVAAPLLPAGPERTTGRAFQAADPSALFDTLMQQSAILGVALLDGQGLVLAGRFADDAQADPAALGAVLSAAIGEAVRAGSHLGMGDYRGLLLETERAVLHLSSMDDEFVVLLASRRGAPTGWIMRQAAQARVTAKAYLGGAHV
jgi:tetratricopeptide (TPR) repeat protein